MNTKFAIVLAVCVCTPANLTGCFATTDNPTTSAGTALEEAPATFVDG
jgi:hypothetical protein